MTRKNLIEIARTALLADQDADAAVIDALVAESMDEELDEDGYVDGIVTAARDQIAEQD